MNSFISKILDQTYFKIYGRYYYDDKLHLYNSCSGIEFKTNSDVLIKIDSFDPRLYKQDAYIGIIIDDDIYHKDVRKIVEGSNVIEIKISKLSKVTILKNNEAIDNHIIINDLVTNVLPLNEEYLDALVIGDSTTAGFGNLGTLEEEKTTKNSDGIYDYCFLALKELNYIPHVFSASGWGLTGSIWTTPKDARLDEQFDYVCVKENHKFNHHLINPKYILISLGTNDATYIKEISTYTKERLEDFINSYIKFIHKLKSLYPSSIIYMLCLPLENGYIYDALKEVVTSLSEDDDVKLIKLDCDQNGCSYHPSLKSHLAMKEILKTEIKKGYK